MGDDKYLLGFCEISNQINDDVDLGMKDDYIAEVIKIYKAKTVRVWLQMPRILTVLENDELVWNEEGVKKLESYLSKLQASGAERFLLLDWEYLYPYGYCAKDWWVVPDPTNESGYYKRFLNLQLKIDIKKKVCFNLLKTICSYP